MTFYEQWRSKQKDAIQPYIYTASILMGEKKETENHPALCPTLQKVRNCCPLSIYTEKHFPYKYVTNIMDGRPSMFTSPS